MSLLIPKYKNFTQIRQIGEYDVFLPDPPDLSKIDGYKLNEDKQMFQVVAPFEKSGFTDLNEYWKREWDRRKNGYWFYNNGNIEYVTGNHYLYLNYWYMPVNLGGRKKLGLPSFVDSDRDFWLIWKDTVDDLNSAGLFFITNRRDGKSEKGMCMIYNDITQTFEAEAGIQSKTGEDAKQIFLKIVKRWQKMPEAFKPTDEGITAPKSSLRFYEPSKKSGKGRVKTYSPALRSEIHWANSKEEAYDGFGLYRIYHDETGKTTEADVHDRWNICKETLVDGDTFTGKGLMTTTVEEMEKKGGKNAKLIWDESDPSKRDGFGRTISGLRRYFKPASYGFRGVDRETGMAFIDPYGYSRQDQAQAYFEKRRDSLSGDQLLSERRKYPLNIRDVFIQEVKSNLFDTGKIEEQMQHNETIPAGFVVQGNFSWKNGIQDSEVVWNPTEGGRWMISWLPRPDDRNKKIVFGSKRRPNNTGECCSGVDPFDHKLTPDNKTSNAGSYVFRKLNPLDPHQTNIFVCEYLHRHKNPDYFYEDMIMQSVFYGCELLCEDNKPGLINHFDRRGYSDYLMERPEETMSAYIQEQHKKAKNEGKKGIPMTGDAARGALINATASYIYENIGCNKETGTMGKCYFNKLLQQWLDFDPSNWTPFDAVVGAGLALLAARKYEPAKQQDNMNWRKHFIKTYKIEGNNSRLL